MYLGTQSNIGSKRRELPPAYLTGDTTVYLFTNDKLLTSCIRRYLVSRACEWVTPALSAMLLIFSFQFSLLFLHVGSQAAAVALRGLPKSNIGRCWKRGKFLVRDFELTLTVKLETRHPIDGYFGSQFRVICNHCRAMAAWSCKTWKFVEKFLSFFGKTTSLRQSFQNSVPKVFTVTPIDAVLFKFREILPVGNLRNRALFTEPKSK